MIVCSCNLMTEEEIRHALSEPNGPRCVRDVYLSLGCTPDCGGCAGSIEHMVQEAIAEDLYMTEESLQKATA